MYINIIQLKSFRRKVTVFQLNVSSDFWLVNAVIKACQDQAFRELLSRK